MSKKGKPFYLEAATSDLLRAMARIVPAVERRNTIPILGCVEVAVGFGTCALRVTDLDMELRTEIKARGDSAICLPAYRLFGLLKAVSHVETIEMKADENGVVTVMAGDVTATMNGLPTADLPVFAFGSKAWSAALADGVFRFLMAGVSHAISTEETRYYLNGVCLEVREGALIAVATDGHRLAKREAGLPGKIEDQGAIIVPRKSVGLAVALASLGEATVAPYRSADDKRVAYIEIVAGEVRLRSKLIDGKFPDWRRVVPEPSNTIIEVETKALRRALRATAINHDSRRHQATKISASTNGIEVSSRSPDDGAAKARLGCPVTGALPVFGVNGHYLDGIAAEMEKIGSKTMRVHVTDGSGPLRIMPDAAIAGTLNVLMPMRV